MGCYLARAPPSARAAPRVPRADARGHGLDVEPLARAEITPDHGAVSRTFGGLLPSGGIFMVCKANFITWLNTGPATASPK